MSSVASLIKDTTPPITTLATIPEDYSPAQALSGLRDSILPLLADLAFARQAFANKSVKGFQEDCRFYDVTSSFKQVQVAAKAFINSKIKLQKNQRLSVEQLTVKFSHTQKLHHFITQLQHKMQSVDNLIPKKTPVSESRALKSALKTAIKASQTFLDFVSPQSSYPVPYVQFIQKQTTETLHEFDILHHQITKEIKGKEDNFEPSSLQPYQQKFKALVSAWQETGLNSSLINQTIVKLEKLFLNLEFYSESISSFLPLRTQANAVCLECEQAINHVLNTTFDVQTQRQLTSKLKQMAGAFADQLVVYHPQFQTYFAKVGLDFPIPWQEVHALQKDFTKMIEKLVQLEQEYCTVDENLERLQNSYNSFLTNVNSDLKELETLNKELMTLKEKWKKTELKSPEMNQKFHHVDSLSRISNQVFSFIERDSQLHQEAQLIEGEFSQFDQRWENKSSIEQTLTIKANVLTLKVREWQSKKITLQASKTAFQAQILKLPSEIKECINRKLNQSSLPLQHDILLIPALQERIKALLVISQLQTFDIAIAAPKKEIRELSKRLDDLILDEKTTAEQITNALNDILTIQEKFNKIERTFNVLTCRADEAKLFSSPIQESRRSEKLFKIVSSTNPLIDSQVEKLSRSFEMIRKDNENINTAKMALRIFRLENMFETLNLNTLHLHLTSLYRMLDGLQNDVGVNSSSQPLQGFTFTPKHRDPSKEIIRLKEFLDLSQSIKDLNTGFDQFISQNQSTIRQLQQEIEKCVDEMKLQLDQEPNVIVQSHYAKMSHLLSQRWNQLMLKMLAETSELKIFNQLQTFTQTLFRQAVSSQELREMRHRRMKGEANWEDDKNFVTEIELKLAQGLFLEDVKSFDFTQELEKNYQKTRALLTESFTINISQSPFALVSPFQHSLETTCSDESAKLTLQIYGFRMEALKRLERLWANSLETRLELQSNIERARLVRATEGSSYTTETRHIASKMVGATFASLTSAGSAALSYASYLLPRSQTEITKE